MDYETVKTGWVEVEYQVIVYRSAYGDQYDVLMANEAESDEWFETAEEAEAWARRTLGA